jgi:hypothetical protein
MTEPTTPSGDGRPRPAREHVDLETEFCADAERSLDDQDDDEAVDGSERDIPIEAPITDVIDQHREVELDDEDRADRD